MGEDEEKIEIELEHDDIDEMYYQGLWGFRTDEKYQFFYDESNNCRKFWIKPDGGKGLINTDAYEDFVLAGIVHEKEDYRVTLDEIKDCLGLQKNVREIKFKTQFASGDFLECMKKKRLTSLFKWIDLNGLYIHYHYVNNLYYAVVDIIDSIVDINEVEEYGFQYFLIKSSFYKMLKGKEHKLQKLMFRYCYPNIRSEDIRGFCTGLTALFDRRYDLKPEEKFISGLIQRASNNESLIFVQNNTDFIMKENYVEFYINPIRMFKNSYHTFDEELAIQEVLSQYRLTRNGKEVTNFKFVNSKTDVLVQISDVIAGVMGKFLSYINKSELIGIRRDVNGLNRTQIENIMLLNGLRDKSNNKNVGFLQAVTAQYEIDKMNHFLDLVTARNEAT